MNQKNIWTIIITVIITAVVVGGIVYVWQKSYTKSTKNDLQQQITLLQDQIKQLQQVQQDQDQNEVSDWKIYTNPTFGYSIKYPPAWIAKQGKVLEAGLSEDIRNMNIAFYSGNTLMLRISTDYKTKVGDLSLLSLASEIPPPADKTTVSDITTYKIGNIEGYRRLVIVSDPTFQGLEYITKDSNYIYHFISFEKTESADIVNMLKTFTIK